mmetsp:Transcript_74587/g.218478  ORF Transcript_74587/g.218478 Transcript_74587/m.218478 type:complete len:288 (+) Transcript_74587:1081-1944(+)
MVVSLLEQLGLDLAPNAALNSLVELHQRLRKGAHGTLKVLASTRDNQLIRLTRTESNTKVPLQHLDEKAAPADETSEQLRRKLDDLLNLESLECAEVQLRDKHGELALHLGHVPGGAGASEHQRVGVQGHLQPEAAGRAHQAPVRDVAAKLRCARSSGHCGHGLGAQLHPGLFLRLRSPLPLRGHRLITRSPVQGPPGSWSCSLPAQRPSSGVQEVAVRSLAGLAVAAIAPPQGVDREATICEEAGVTFRTPLSAPSVRMAEGAAVGVAARSHCHHAQPIWLPREGG